MSWSTPKCFTISLVAIFTSRILLTYLGGDPQLHGLSNTDRVWNTLSKDKARRGDIHPLWFRSERRKGKDDQTVEKNYEINE